MSPRSIGSLSSNGWGLYDMHGNVWEWCDGEYVENADREAGTRGRVIRGGAYDSRPEECRSGWREGRDSGAQAANVGFRVVMDVE